MTNRKITGTDLAEEKVLDDIAEYGWHATNVVEDDGHSPWTFTIGLYDTSRFPELMIIGRSRVTAQACALPDRTKTRTFAPVMTDMMPSA